MPRIVLGLACVGGLPLAVVSIQLSRVNVEGMTNQVLSTHTYAARATSERVEALIEGLRSAAAPLARNSALLDRPKAAASLELLAGFLEYQRGVFGVIVVNDKGAEVVRMQRAEHRDLVSAALDQPATEMPGIIETSAGRALHVAVPLAEELGWLRVIADADSLRELLNPRDLDKEADLVIASRDGALVAASHAISGLETFPEGMLEVALSGKIGGAGRFDTPTGPVLAAYNPILGTTWVVLSRQPASVAERAARRMQWRTLLAVAVATLLAAAISAGAYTSVVKPLRGLIATQRQLAGMGDRPTRGNEIAALKESLAALERRRHDRDEIGKIFLGRYQVLEVIGEGGMGSVFRGWDPKLKRPVALKTIRLSAEQTKKQDMATSLIREAITVARFQHPNIVSVYDVEDSTEAAFVAMEYVDGITLQEHLRVQRTLTPGNTIVLGLALANALAAAHEHEFVHHDVKPGNVLLGFDGSIKMADFGIARCISEWTGGSGQVFGTPGYLPPEALLGKGYDARGDVFALGTILYHCLAGQHPFFGGNLQHIFTRTIRGERTGLDELCPLTPPPLIGIIHSMLEPQPELRPESAQAVVESMRELLRSHPYRWTAPSAGHRAEQTDLESDHELFRSQLLPTSHLSRG